MNCRNLPGISGIEYCFANQLYTDTQELIREGSVIRAIGNFVEIPVSKLANCIITTETVSGQTIYTTTVKFKMIDKREETRKLIDTITMSLCSFRITDVYKEKYLIGIDKKPHPVFLPSYKIDELPSGLRVFEAQITYTNIFSILQLKD